VILYFLRHGPAGDRETWQGSDFDRPLTPDGRKRIAREAQSLRELKLVLDVIVTSPLVRARQTAEIVAKELRLHDALVEDERVDTEFSLERLARLLDDHHDVDAIMLVGHEPSMSEVISLLIGGADLDLKKGSVAAVDVRGGSPLTGRLIWLASPKLLAHGVRLRDDKDRTMSHTRRSVVSDTSDAVIAPASDSIS